MKPIVTIINDAITNAGAQCLPCERVRLDHEHWSEYVDSGEHRVGDLFESPPPNIGTVPPLRIDSAIPSILCYFLDGSRRTYKVADLLVRGRYLPVIAGQVGVGILHRDPITRKLKPLREHCGFKSVLTFPDQVGTQDLDTLAQHIREESGRSFDLLRYTVKEEHDPVDLGIAKIMDHMAQLELSVVQAVSEMHLLNGTAVLVKDGPLRYKNIRGRGFDITQFRNVIGLSKTFRPSFTVGTGRGKRDVGTITAHLEIGQRTPVFKTIEEERFIGVWYLRIRPRLRMANPLQGIVKVECYAIDDQELQEGLHADRVDHISAHLLRERNVTPYGKDSRWASHIYPIYSIESFIKSNFQSDIRFEALF